MIKYYNSIFDEKQCKHISNGMLDNFKNNKTVTDNTVYSNGATGFFNLKETLDLLPYVHNIVTKDYGEIYFQNTYTRIYRNTNTLKCHTDRKDLDVTISICVFSNLTFEWPIFISNVQINHPWDNNLPIHEYKADATSYITPVGSGVACLGIKNPHWRETLNCNEDQMVIQTFYHWKYM